MATDEFEEQARQIGDRILALPDDQRIAAACRGSANPAALAWLGEALGLSAATSLVDLGAGMGGPLAWFRVRYDCAGIAMEPSGAAASAAASLFGLVALRGSGEATPFRDRGFEGRPSWPTRYSPRSGSPGSTCLVAATAPIPTTGSA